MNELAEHLKNDHFSDYIGIERFLYDDGTWSARLTITEKHLNGLHVAQGGAIFTLADYTTSRSCAQKSHFTGAGVIPII